MSTFRKHDSRPGRIAYEVAGLRWLSAAGPQAVPIVPVLDHGPDWLEEPRLTLASPTPQAAENFGRELAHLHAAGASHLGAPPDGFHANGWMGEAPLSLLPHPTAVTRSWGSYYARHRLAPHSNAAPFTPQQQTLLNRFYDKLDSGVYDHAQPALVRNAGHPASRTHGDMWSGNVIWTPEGVVLIDPAAQGGHGEEDLAALAVFGAPHTQRIWAAYNEASPLDDGWEERLPLHQLHILMVHCQLFGSSYVPETLSIVQRFL